MFSIIDQIVDSKLPNFIALKNDNMNGDFISLHYLHKFIYKCNKVYLIVFNQPYAHYYKILIRYGINLESDHYKNKIEIYDLSYFLTDTNEKALFIDLTCLENMGLSLKSICNLVYYICVNSCTHNGYLLFSYSVLPESNVSSFETLIDKFFDQKYIVEKLSTGSSEQFHGKIRIYNKLNDTLSSSMNYLYKLTERNLYLKLI